MYAMLSKKKIRRALHHLAKEAKTVAGREALQILHAATPALAASAGAAGGPLAAVATTELARVAGKKIKGRGAYMTGRGVYSRGRGSYTTALNTTSATNHNGLFSHSAPGVPSFSSTSSENGTITISKRECIGSINATGRPDWYNQSFAINPGLKAVFPWLSQIAPNFSEYEMMQCIFEYEPVVSPMSVSSVGSLGSVVMSCNYNSGASKYATFTQAIESSNAVRGTIANNIVMGVECDPKQNANRSNLYVRAGAVPQNQDIKTYDLAMAQVGLYGVPTQYVNGTQLGLLWVTYKVKLSKTLFFDGMGLAISTDAFHSGGTITVDTLFGSSPQMSPNNSIGGFVSTINNIYTFPDDYNGLVNVEFYARGAFTGYPSITPSGNVVPFDYYWGTPGAVTNHQAWMSDRCLMTIVFVVTPTNIANANSVEFDVVGSVVTVTNMLIQEVNPSVTTDTPYVPI